ncbi:MAG: alpha/beta hydrolase [Ilumatobacteraceae bacterium]|nr:alpha/beta hydrolase [Ilumatobacteraceae bacterium]
MHIDLIAGPDGRLEVRVAGRGTTLVMIASLGRSADDFDELAELVAAVGYRVVAPEPRGIRGSEPGPDDVDLRGLSDDVAAVIAHYGGPAFVLGHAFGNRVARMVATRHPTLVAGVILLGCGGAILPEPVDGRALIDVFDESLDAERHLEAVRRAFFAPGNDPAPWRDGWHPAVAQMQGRSMTDIDPDVWWRSGDARVLVVQAANDVIAPPANGEKLIGDLGNRGELRMLGGAGHAMLPEQPVQLAEMITDWLRRHG